MALQEKQLGQVRSAVGGTAESIYSPATGVIAIVKGIFICNVTTVPVKVKVFIDDDGAVFDETTAIVFNLLLEVESFIDISTFIAMNNDTGSIGVECDTANGANFTIFGAEVT